MAEYESLTSFARTIKNKMESGYGAQVELDTELARSGKIGFQRDDLYRFMIVLPVGEDWPPSEMHAYVPEELDMIADRPGVPIEDIEPVKVSTVLRIVDGKAPEYNGAHTYQ